MAHPDKLITMIRLLHDEMTASVICEGQQVEPFPVKVGVEQGCVLAPTLFALFMGTVLQLAEPQLRNQGVQITFRFDGNMFNLQRIKAKTKVSWNFSMLMMLLSAQRQKLGSRE